MSVLTIITAIILLLSPIILVTAMIVFAKNSISRKFIKHPNLPYYLFHISLTLLVIAVLIVEYKLPINF